jgi:hypothetical protein
MLRVAPSARTTTNLVFLKTTQRQNHRLVRPRPARPACCPPRHHGLSCLLSPSPPSPFSFSPTPTPAAAVLTINNQCQLLSYIPASCNEYTAVHVPGFWPSTFPLPLPLSLSLLRPSSFAASCIAVCREGEAARGAGLLQVCYQANGASGRSPTLSLNGVRGCRRCAKR